MPTRLTDAIGAAVRAWRGGPHRGESLSRARRDAVIASVSHELRTPMTILRGVADTLEGQNLVDVRGSVLLDAQRRALDALERLVDDVLMAAEAMENGPGRQETSLVDLVEVCRDLLGSRPSSIHVDEGGANPAGPADVPRPGPDLQVTTVPDLLNRALGAAVAQQWQVVPSGQGLEVRLVRDVREARVEIRCSDEPVPTGPGGPMPAGSGGVGLNLLIAEALLDHVGGSVEVVEAGTTDQRIVVRLPQRRRVDRTVDEGERRSVVIPAGYVPTPVP